MTYGLQLFNSVGTKTFDSVTAKGGYVVDILTAGISARTISFTAFDSNRTALAIIVSGLALTEATPGHDGSGHPTITIPAYYGAGYPPGVYMVFIL